MDPILYECLGICSLLIMFAVSGWFLWNRPGLGRLFATIMHCGVLGLSIALLFGLSIDLPRVIILDYALADAPLQAKLVGWVVLAVFIVDSMGFFSSLVFIIAGVRTFVKEYVSQNDAQLVSSNEAASSA